MPSEGYERIGSVSSDRDLNSHSPLQPDDAETSPFPKYEAPLASQPSLDEPKVHKKKIYAVVFLFLLSLVAFVSQTELTSYLYNGLGYNQPYLLLYLTHTSWIFIWPIQVFAIVIFKHFKKSHAHGYSPFNPHKLKRHLHDSLKNQHRNIYKTSGIIINKHYIHESDYPQTIRQFIFSASILSILKRIALLSFILNLAGCTWYISMGISPASDVTAIYNCSAFSALVLAVPILKERFTYLKLSSVMIALFGVFYVSYSGQDDSEDTPSNFPYRIWGDVIIAFGAVLYGLYEVLYKKLVCPPDDAVSSRRQVAFSNFSASLIGLVTASFLWILIVLADWFDISKFDLTGFTAYTWLIIGLSIVSNLVFSLSFLSLMSLTSPVLSSVSSLVTILFVGISEWVIFGIQLTPQQLIGNFFIVVGFVVLSYSYWNELNKEDVDDADEYVTDLEESSVNNF
jgi:drug/metabolite transporter (DMT)-like permease